MKYKVFFIFLFVGLLNVFAQVNAGGSRTICGVETTLHGTGSPDATFNWTIVSKPSEASDPIFSNPTILGPTVSGMNTPGPYKFKITQNLSGQITESEVTITSTGDKSSFSAGNDITTISATTGIATLSGTIPNGYTASWSYYNISEFERYGSKINKNATMSNVNSANPTLELTKKANHDIDPAYRAVLRITSIYDPNCWYEDDAIVRFIPNEKLVFNTTHNRCYSLTSPLRFINLAPSSPLFSTDVPNASGNPTFGTTITVNPISQPAGANISFKELLRDEVRFNGVTVVGTYVFTVTITDVNGKSHTTPEITFNYNGQRPEYISFLDAAYPEQMMVYSPGGSGMRIYDKSKIGTTDPITVYFKIDSRDSSTLTTTVSNSGVTPPGGNPTLVLNGAGTRNRSIVATPPAGGWQAGTYRINITTGDGTCTQAQSFYIHISDGNRKNVKVDDLAVCYADGGSVEATIPLPEVYQEKVNDSYLQSYSGGYSITLVSKPLNSSTPTYDAQNFRSFKSTSTKIGGLDKEGVYVFKIAATPFAGGSNPKFIQKEYEYSGAKYEDTFSVTVTKNITANAGGSYTTTTCAPGFPLLGNQDAGPGKWTVEKAPAGVDTSSITFSPDTKPESPYTMVNGATVTGDYTFRWSVGNGSCSSFDDVIVTVADNMPEPIIIVNNTDGTVKVSNYHPTHIYTLPAGLSIDNNGYISGFELNKEYTVKVRPYGTDENTSCFSEGTFEVINLNIDCYDIDETVVYNLYKEEDPDQMELYTQKGLWKDYYCPTSQCHLNPKGQLAAKTEIPYLAEEPSNFAYGDQKYYMINSKGNLLYSEDIIRGIFEDLGNANMKSGYKNLGYDNGMLYYWHSNGMNLELYQSTAPTTKEEEGLVWKFIGNINNRPTTLKDEVNGYTYNLRDIAVDKGRFYFLYQENGKGSRSNEFNHVVFYSDNPTATNPSWIRSATSFKNNGESSYYSFQVLNFAIGSINTKLIAPPVKDVCIANDNTTINLNNAHTGVTPPNAELRWFRDDKHTGTALSANEIANAGEGTYYAFYYYTDTKCYSPAAEVLVTKCIECTNPGLGGTPDGYTTIGITTQTKQQAWPENIPNGLIALESTTKGMVITRVQNSAKITDPKEGMLIYNIDAKCVQLYNGTTWKCIENECKLNNP